MAAKIVGKGVYLFTALLQKAERIGERKYRKKVQAYCDDVTRRAASVNARFRVRYL